MIELNHVSKRYKNAAKSEYALKDVSLRINEGDLAAIVGTSGSGKTTLLNLIGGLDRTYEGAVKVAGQDLGALSDKALARFRNQHIGFGFQQFNLLDHRTVLENVLLPAYFAKEADMAALTEWAKRSLTDLGIGDKIDQRPSNLSGGQKQRVAIARALLFKPRLLLCDEPTGSLDTTTGQQIIDLFGALNAEGYTVVIITHEARVSEAARRIVHIEDGAIVEGGLS